MRRMFQACMAFQLAFLMLLVYMKSKYLSPDRYEIVVSLDEPGNTSDPNYGMTFQPLVPEDAVAAAEEKNFSERQEKELLERELGTAEELVRVGEEDETSPGRDLKRILFWTPYWDHYDYRFGLGRAPFIEYKCQVDLCETTSARSMLNESDAVIVHVNNVENLDNDIPPYHIPNQPWIYFNMEPPSETRIDLTPLNGKFNLSMSYRADSDIPTPWGKLVPLTEGEKEKYEKMGNVNFAEGRNRKVAWFVSHCPVQSGRDWFAQELQKHISVDIFGRCGYLDCGDMCNKMVRRDYKFYLAFENSLCDYYISEKLWRAVFLNVIPIVVGGSGYSSSLPEHSYIDVKDFNSVKALADYLHLLDQNDTLYNEYFKWHSESKVIFPYNIAHSFCDICARLHDKIEPKVIDDLAEWYTGPNVCKNASEYYRHVEGFPQEDIIQWGIKNLPRNTLASNEPPPRYDEIPESTSMFLESKEQNPDETAPEERVEEGEAESPHMDAQGEKAQAENQPIPEGAVPGVQPPSVEDAINAIENNPDTGLSYAKQLAADEGEQDTNVPNAEDSASMVQSGSIPFYAPSPVGAQEVPSAMEGGTPVESAGISPVVAPAAEGQVTGFGMPFGLGAPLPAPGPQSAVPGESVPPAGEQVAVPAGAPIPESSLGASAHGVPPQPANGVQAPIGMPFGAPGAAANQPLHPEGPPVPVGSYQPASASDGSVVAAASSDQYGPAGLAAPAEEMAPAPPVGQEPAAKPYPENPLGPAEPYTPDAATETSEQTEPSEPAGEAGVAVGAEAALYASAAQIGPGMPFGQPMGPALDNPLPPLGTNNVAAGSEQNLQSDGANSQVGAIPSGSGPESTGTETLGGGWTPLTGNQGPDTDPNMQIGFNPNQYGDLGGGADVESEGPSNDLPKPGPDSYSPGNYGFGSAPDTDAEIS